MVSAKARADGLIIKRTIVMPAYAVAIACLTVLLLNGLTLWAGIAIANGNAREQLARYEADKQATAAADKVVTCALFTSQLNAFDKATTPAGKESYEGWLGVYRLARCEPKR